MANTLTLEQAAQRLGLSVEQFKTNLKTHKEFTSLRPLMGGATMHFREQDIAELGRKLGQGSDADLKAEDEQVEIGREPQRPGGSSTRLSSTSNPRTPKPKAEPMSTDSSEDFVPLTPDTSKSGRKRDSDVRVDSGKKTLPPAATEGTEEIIDLAGSQPKTGSGKTPKSGKVKSPAKKDEGSDFELKLGTDSDSEFELTLADDSGEVPLGGSSRDATGKTGKSGVKLNRPDDSGISLEKDSDSDFELNLDSSSSKKIAGPKPSSGKNKSKKKSDDSEFELALDDSSGEIPAAKESGEQKDIFATDFDIPALDDSASEAVALEDSGDTDLESSDFDLDAEAAEVDESASEVVQLDDDLAEGDVVEVDDKVTSGKKKRRRADDDISAEEALADVDEEEEEEMAAAGAAAPTRWGPLPALVLFPCLFVLMIVSFMGFELLHGMWSYRTVASKPTYTLTRGIAGMFSDTLPPD